MGSSLDLQEWAREDVELQSPSPRSQALLAAALVALRETTPVGT